MSDSTIPREVAEGLRLINDFYGFAKEGDPDQYILREEFRQDSYRMIVFQFHLSIDDLLRSLLYERLCRIPGRAVFNDQQNIDYVSRLSTSQAIDLSTRLGVLTELGRNELVRLNKIRNDCAHNWTLHSYKMVKKTKGGPKKRRYKIEFNGNNLLNLKTMEEEFIPLYSGVYLELFMVNYSMDWERKYLQPDVTGPPSKKIQ